MLRHSALLIVPLLTLTVCAVEYEKKPVENPAQTALAELNDLIGGWRGIGQPQRGSASGAWKESADWSWSFEDGEPALIYKVEEGKHLAVVRLTFSPKEKMYLAEVTYTDESTRQFSGRLDEKRLQLVSDPDDLGQRQRLTITQLNEKRTLVLLERSIALNRYFRIAEVGYTREGTRLAIPGVNGPECVVTGGRGTTPVSYKGKTYYVCCTGCKQAFEDDPEGIIAAYEEKLAARKSGN